MDTSGHHEISEVGEKLLRPALERVNRKKMRIGAFYMGNWLTDVSQSVDRRAYRGALEKSEQINRSLNELFDRMRYDAPSWIPKPFGTDVFALLLDQLRSRLKGAEAGLMAQLEILLKQGTNGELAKTFKSVFHFVGYFKFVMDKNGSSETQMDPACYDKVFEDRFRQYFPHEHLDRPETATPGHYESQKANAPLNTRTKNASKEPIHDLYAYLREDIKISAGLIAELDGGAPTAKANAVSWAAGTFHPKLTSFTDAEGKAHPIDDKDFEWNRHLALLGHALHAVEDYFAHSNFVEHASAALPNTYNRFQRWEEQETLARRLKTLRPGFDDAQEDWKKLLNDSHVATGYFDFHDTLISLEHLLDKTLKRPHDKLSTSVDKATEYDYSKLLRDTLELCEDPKKVWSAPVNNPAHHDYDADDGNSAVKWLREKGGKKLALTENREARLNLVTQWMIHSGPLKSSPPSVQQSFVASVQGLGKLAGAGALTFSLYKALTDVVDFFETPLGWLAKYVPPLVYEQLKKYGEVYVKNLILDYLGAKRIGCHSLMAKDTGPELFHKAAMDCAKAVHWYVVQTLTRHSREQVAHVARSDEEDKKRNKLYRWEWIDWLELLEYFLAHPLASIRVKTGERILSASSVHITRKGNQSLMSPDSLASLAGEYAPTFKHIPGGPQVFTWEEIADANFPTKGMTTAQRKIQINKVLKVNNEGLVVKDGINYAFRPGLRIVIPYQKAVVEVAWGKESQHRWWFPVITKGYKEITAWFENGELSAKAPPDAHRWFPIPRREELQLAKDATSLRAKEEKAYD